MENVSPLILQRRTLTLARFTALLRDITSQSALTKGKKKKKTGGFLLRPFFSFFLFFFFYTENFAKISLSWHLVVLRPSTRLNFITYTYILLGVFKKILSSRFHTRRLINVREDERHDTRCLLPLKNNSDCSFNCYCLCFFYTPFLLPVFSLFVARILL